MVHVRKPQFEFKKFGARFECVPIAFWDTASEHAVLRRYEDSVALSDAAEFIDALVAVGLASPGSGVREVTNPFGKRRVFRAASSHGWTSSKGTPGGMPGRAPLTGVPQHEQDVRGAQSRAKSVASLDGVTDIVIRKPSRIEPPEGRVLDQYKHK